MTGTKRKGRPVTREAPAAGKRTQLSVAIPQPLKRQVEKAAKAHGWSISAETDVPAGDVLLPSRCDHRRRAEKLYGPS